MYNNLFSIREGLGTIFDVRDYPVAGRLYLRNGDKIVLKALANLIMDGSFSYIVNKLPKELFKDNNEQEKVNVINIKPDDVPLHYSWEFIPMNLDFDILKGERGKIYANFNFSMSDGNNHSGRFVPLMHNGKFCTIEVY